MWSTSPADRILSVPPFASHVTGVGGGAVEMVDGDEVPPASEEDEDPHPAARKARLRECHGTRPDGDASVSCSEGFHRRSSFPGTLCMG